GASARRAARARVRYGCTHGRGLARPTVIGSGPMRTLPLALVIGAAALAQPGCIPIPDPSAPASHAPPRPPGKNPLAGARFYVEPGWSAKSLADSWRSKRPADAAAVDRIASQPQASWFGDWSGKVAESVDRYVSAAADDGTVPLMVVYNI